MFPIIQVGSLAIQVPGLLLLLGLWLGLSLSEKFSKKQGVHPETLYNLVFISLIAGLLGARLAYAGRFSQAFIESPGSLLSINPGLLDPVGGIAAALLGGVIYGQRKKLAFWPTLDALTPLFAVLAIAASLSNLSSGSGFGAGADLPWSIEIWGARRHPSQVYEILAAAAVLLALWPGRSGSKKWPSGSYFLQFMVLSAGSRLFLEGFRGDSVVLGGGLRVVQLAAWVTLAAGLWILRARSRTAQS